LRSAIVVLLLAICWWRVDGVRCGAAAALLLL
jgi:hypothetical protein